MLDKLLETLIVDKSIKLEDMIIGDKNNLTCWTKNIKLW